MVFRELPHDDVEDDNYFDTSPDDQKKDAHVKKAVVHSTEGNNFLHVISVVFSPYGQQTRFKLAQEYIERMQETQKTQPMKLYILEVQYEHQKLTLNVKENHTSITVPKNFLLWNKENLINIVVQHFLPKDWKYCAWIDADIEFLDPHWVTKTIDRFRETHADVLQLFSFCRFLDKNNQVSRYLKSSLFGYVNNIQNKVFHPGFAWGCTRSAYEKMHGLFEYAIVGGGDRVLSQALTRCIPYFKSDNVHHSLHRKVQEFHDRVSQLSGNYVNTIIQHHYHGEKKNRQYSTRQKILVRHQFNPDKHVLKDPSLGFLIPNFPKDMAHDIEKFFKTRKEKF
jgi:hypothetical protein